MSSSSQQHCRSGKYRGLMNFAKTHYDSLPFIRRKTDAHNLKISVKPELATKISNREFSAVRQQMQGLNHNSVTINGQVRKGGLHSILFDNINNKADHQILGVILDACSHFVRKKSRNSRYITFSSNLNESRSFNQNESCETCISEGSDSRFSGFRFKKINISFAALLAVAMCFFVSCGGDSSKLVNGDDESVSNFGKLGQECYPNETCDKGLICDTEKNVCVEDPDNPTDTGSDKPGNQEKPNEQNNQNDQDKPVEQPDENHQENQNDQDTPVEQPDEDHQENQNDQDTPIEQPDQDHQENQNDQDTPVEQPDQDVPVNPTDVCHGEGCQGNRGCKAGYVWVGELASYYVDTGGDPDYNCIPCTASEMLVEMIRNRNSYCPGGDDLKDKFSTDNSLSNQIEKCPEYTRPNDKLDDCVCEYGVPPPPKEECFPPAQTTRKKPLIISPKVNN